MFSDVGNEGMVIMLSFMFVTVAVIIGWNVFFDEMPADKFEGISDESREAARKIMQNKKW